MTIEKYNITPHRVYRKIIESPLLSVYDTSFIYYSRHQLKKRLDVLRFAFERSNTLHTIAIKSNPHPKILKYIVSNGFGLEAASFEEVLIAANTGVENDKIIYNSPVKTRQELDYCADKFPGIQINANSLEELSRIPQKNTQIGLRINPLVQPSTLSIYNVSSESSKFGVPVSEKQDIINAVMNYNVSTIHMHIGSRIENTDSLLKALRIIIDLCNIINDLSVRSKGYAIITSINIGGGLSALESIKTSDLLMQKYASEVQSIISNSSYKFKLIDEFGQWIHKHNCIAFSKVEYVKKYKNKLVALIHLGADFFPREIYSLNNTLKFVFLGKNGKPKKSKSTLLDLAGPLCFNGDYLIRDLKAPSLQEGDVVAIPSVGSNTFGLWSRHCSRTIPKYFSDSVENEDLIEVLSERTNPFVHNYF